jgi:dipeptidase
MYNVPVQPYELVRRTVPRRRCLCLIAGWRRCGRAAAAGDLVRSMPTPLPQRQPCSCDTFVILDGPATLLGKNSDRPAFDCQPLRRHPAHEHDPGSTITLEYKTIPQVAMTRATVGSSPYWCWGYEMAMNDAGVAGGNEAIFTKELARTVAASSSSSPPRLGISGMAMLRLGLERAGTAREAVGVVAELVEEHGQWGSAVPGMDHATGSYDNSFIFADGTEAWVLETAGREWVALRYTSGWAAISNEPTIRTEWTLRSSSLIEHAVQQKWWPSACTAEFVRAMMARPRSSSFHHRLHACSRLSEGERALFHLRAHLLGLCAGVR